MLRWGAGTRPVPPPGIAAAAYAAALFEDVAEVALSMAGVDTLVLCPPGQAVAAAAVLWPQVPVVEQADTDLAAAAAGAGRRGYRDIVLVAGDAPDLPALILAKVFQALARSPVVLAPADGGGAVAIGVRLPAPAWLTDVDVDTPAALSQAQRAAPQPDRVEATAGWHRLRAPADIARLDLGLEGWEATRVLLGRR